MADEHQHEGDCPLGVTVSELHEILGPRSEAFFRWMSGQTMAICDGQFYDHESREYEPNGCAASPHGVVVYRHDLERFLRNLPIVD